MSADPLVQRIPPSRGVPMSATSMPAGASPEATGGMPLRDAAHRDFRLLDAGWPRARSVEIVRRSKAGHVVIRRIEPGLPEPRFYVLDAFDVRERLHRSSARQTGEALKLFAEDPALAVSADSARAGLDDWQVVVDGGVPVAIVKPHTPTRGASAPARGDAGEPALRVERDLGAQWPDSVASGASVSLIVALTLPGSAHGSTRSMRAALGTRIDVEVHALQGVTLQGSDSGALIVSDPQDGAALVFQFKAGAAGTGSVRVRARCGAYSIASMDLHTSILEAARLDAAPAQVRQWATVPVEPRAQPDLSLLVSEMGTEIHFRLQSTQRAGDGQSYPAVKLAQSSRAYFEDFCRKIENLPVDTEGLRKTAAMKMQKWGVDMMERVLPPELRATLWNMRERIGSMQVTSDEAWIPWEVCRLVTNTASGAKVEGPFLAEAFCISRWLHGVAPPTHFRFQQWALVVPKDSRLPNAPGEEEFIRAMGNGQRTVTPVGANFCDLAAALESERFDAWHFCGHAHAGSASDSDQAAIELDGNESMTVDLFSGTLENALSTSPFVFLNACQSARGGLTLTGVGGWAQRFIRPAASSFAASAFLGSYWSVYDSAALAFTQALYRGLIDERKAIGAAVRDARLAVRTPDDPLTWLAYTVYADPLATVAPR